MVLSPAEPWLLHPASSTLGEVENGVDIDYWGEFGPELSTVVPYAYYLFRTGRLGNVTTSRDMECFYYFCNTVDDRYAERTYLPPAQRSKLGLPNPDEHKSHLDLAQWTAPSYRAEYENKIFQWSKPTLIISNKYNTEWGAAPVNFINLAELERIFDLLIDDYKIVYNRPLPSNVASDNSETSSFTDLDLVSKYDDVTTMQDLHEMHPEFTFNELQLRVYANCRHFISVQGGNAVLASYFGGVNVVKALRGQETRRGDFRYFPMFAGTTVFPCTSEFLFVRTVEAVFASGEKRLVRTLFTTLIKINYGIRIRVWTLLRYLRRVMISGRNSGSD